MTKEELLPGVIEYFDNDVLSANVWLDKYALKDSSGDIKERTPEDMHRRLAREFARIELNYPNPMTEDEIFSLFDRFRFLVPQGSPMYGIGNDYSLTSLSNCFVIGNNNNSDSYGSILRTDEEQIQLMKRRGGVGHDISHLRPSHALANNVKLDTKAGAVLYAHRYSNSTKEVRQGDRRGALMLSISIKHPDAESFIDAKIDRKSITDANISVRITDAFMSAVESDSDFYQTFPIDLKHGNLNEFNLPYDELRECYDENGNKGYVKKVRAKRMWNKIIHNAWSSAEPGVLFWDKVVSESPADCYEEFKTVCVNPCAELPLSPYDSCRLLAINLLSYVKNPFEPFAEFDFELFNEHVYKAQRLMDDLVDLEIEKVDKIIKKIENDPEPDDIKRVELAMWIKIRDNARRGRRTGLGITAEGDMLAARGLVYGSPEAIEFSSRVHMTMAYCSYKCSIDLAKERGSFPIWNIDKEWHNPFLQRLLGDSNYEPDWKEFGRRNISNLTIAPAGSVSIMTQTTSGVEPCFAIYYTRRRRTIDKTKANFTDDSGEMFEEYMVFHKGFEQWYDKNWYKTDVRLFDLDYRKPLDQYTRQELDILITKSPYHMATAKDVNWVSKVKLQGEIQKWVDHSISSTTNIPEDTTEQVVSDIYREAYSVGCKGMTIYREGSRSGILISEKVEKFNYSDAIKRPESLECDIYHKTALKRNWMILVGLYEDKPYEIFAFQELPNHVFPTKIDKGVITKIKAGVYKLEGEDDVNKRYTIPNIISLIDTGDQVSTRKFSLMLRHRIDPRWIVKDIRAYSLITSFDKVIQRVLQNYIEEDGNLCPECGSKLVTEDGCVKCSSCGFSKCG